MSPGLLWYYFLVKKKHIISYTEGGIGSVVSRSRFLVLLLLVDIICSKFLFICYAARLRVGHVKVLRMDACIVTMIFLLVIAK